MLEDVFILPDENSNSLLILAPEKTQDLLGALIDSLDVAPAAQYVVKVVTLKRMDATAMATMLQQLFLGTSGTAPRATAPADDDRHDRRGRRRPARPRAGGAFGAAGAPAAPPAA